MAVKSERTLGLSILLLCLVACDGGGGSSKGDAAVGGDGDGDGGGAHSQMDGSAQHPGQDGSIPGPGDDGGTSPRDGDGGSDPMAMQQCQQTCMDTNDCTNDRCSRDGVCTHTLNPGACDEGESCHPMQGCTAGKACTMQADCMDNDECTVNERCSQSDQCEFSALDADRDGFPPTSCGGSDCNDKDPRVAPGRTELCNNMDDDCDGVPDNDAVCLGDQVCSAGKCGCPANTMACGNSACADLMTDPRHCGKCGHSCGPAGVCTNGQCSCPAPNTMCGNSCVDTNTSFQHCGGCGNQCDLNPPESCVGGTCSPCGAQAGQPCCMIGNMGFCLGDAPQGQGASCNQTTQKCE